MQRQRENDQVMIKPTTVISVRGRDRLELEADHGFIYVGRSMPRQGWRDKGWGNPYPFRQHRNAAELFARDLADALEGRGNPHPKVVAIARRLPELCGKTLGCWCGSWEPGDPDIGCHAVALAKFANTLR